jgi:phosphatidate cytidylyltransferase
MKLSKIRDLNRRLVTSTIVIVVAGILIAFSPYPLMGLLAAGVIAALAGIAVWEYVQLAQAKNFHPNLKLMIIVAVIEVFAFYFAQRHVAIAQLPLIILFLSVIAFFLAHFRHSYKALAQVAIELFGVCYAAIPLCFMLGILYPYHVDQDGRWWLAYLIVVTKITDVGGYFVGRLWGKRKLAPLLSPKKTVEGAVAGFFCAVLASILCGILGRGVNGFNLGIWQSLWLGALIGILGQIGDLAESLLKRDAFVKDSNSLPGLGGILDMTDSLLLTTPVVYFYVSTL